MKQQKLIIAAFLLISGFAANAEPITHFSSTTVIAYDGDINSFVEVNTNNNPLHIQTDSSETGGTASGNLDYTGVAGRGEAESEASLAAGTLKVRSEAQSFGTGGQFDVDGNGFARADFGDSFRAFDGADAFEWANTTEVTFSIDLSGSVSLGSAAGVNDRADAGFFFVAFQPGTLDAYAQWLINGGPFPGINNQIFSANYALDGQAPEFFETAFGVPAILDVTFAPGGDFDWAAGLFADTAASLTETTSVDFFNTATFSYAGPAGTTTYSASGVFPNSLPLANAPTQAPEPGTLALLALGLAGIGMARRKKKL